jgi:hypothetical protein
MNAIQAEAERVPPPEKEAEKITLFMCGPSKCEHDYSDYEDVMEDGHEDGHVVGMTAVCSKCGARAFDEAAWL